MTTAQQAGARLRTIRNLRRMSQADVETRSGGRWDKVRIQSWETARRDPQIEDMAEYCDWLGLPLLALFPGEGDALFEQAVRVWAAANGSGAMVAAALTAA